MTLLNSIKKAGRSVGHAVRGTEPGPEEIDILDTLKKEHEEAAELLKKLVDSGELGRTHYLYTNRQNLGQVRSDENALHAAVCDGKVTLKAAQNAIAANWETAERKLGLS